MEITRTPITDRDMWLAAARVRFLAFVLPEPNSGCWLWTGAMVPDGYGSFYWGADGRYSLKAHRASWNLFCDEAAAGSHVLHRCDTRPCVNPDHLFLGDNAANVADRVSKGRSASVAGPANGRWVNGASLLRGTVGTPNGERVASAKLRASDIPLIRSAACPRSAIAARYGVSVRTIANIQSGKAWAHVD